MRILLSMFLLLVAGLVCAEEVVREISWSRLNSDGKIMAGQFIARGQTGFDQLKLENTQSTPVELGILTIEKPGITKYTYALKGQIQYSGVEGTGYLEMWSVFPGNQRYFSRTLAGQGPMKLIQGSSSWRPLVIPFFNQEGNSHPISLELKLALPGKGRVMLSDLQLVQYDRNENPLVPGLTSWWGGERIGSMFGTLGACIGVAGALIGILASMGKARVLVMSALHVFLIAGIALFAAGILALWQRQPYAVSYPLLLTGFLLSVLPPGLRGPIHRRYEQLELRKMRSADL